MKERAEAAQSRNRYSLVYLTNLAVEGRFAGSASGRGRGATIETKRPPGASGTQGET